MPKVLQIGPYVLFFWIDDSDEPVHIHVALRRPAENATKFWLTQNGGCILASNGSAISKKDLRSLAEAITCNHALICRRWTEYFGRDHLRFYA